jgi:glycine hydroxymethyltransferase
VLELANIAANKNTTPQDTSALIPSGLRMGVASAALGGAADGGDTRQARPP